VLDDAHTCKTASRSVSPPRPPKRLRQLTQPAWTTATPQQTRSPITHTTFALHHSITIIIITTGHRDIASSIHAIATMSTKPAKTKTVVLKLSPKALLAFPYEPTAAPEDPKPASSPNTPASKIVEPSPDTPADASTPMNGSNTPSLLAPPATGAKRKGPAPKKRGITAVDGSNGASGTNGSNGTPKPRGKPGPKAKKQKLGDMINDPNSTTPLAASGPAQKLGPKANAGAINANLRSLDRTGKFKCRKWQKTGFRIRTFTGSVVELPSWKASQRAAAFSEDVKSDSTGSTDTKIKDESSAVSEKSGLTPAPPPLDAMASSPAPVAAAS
jgi:hypothetical protein